MPKFASLFACTFLFVAFIQAAEEPTVVKLEMDAAIFLDSVFSPDGKKVITTVGSDTAQIWETETGKELLKLPKRPANWRNYFFGNPCICLANFSPDGKKVVLGNNDNTIRIFDAETGESLNLLKVPMRFDSSVAFSPDCKKIVVTTLSGASDLALILDAESGEVLKILESDKNGDENFAMSAIFSADGTKIVVGNYYNGTALIFDAKTGEKLKKLEGHTGLLWYAVFSPDGKKVATTSGDHTVRIWDVESGKELQKLESDDFAKVAFSPDGKKIVAADCGKTALIWDTETGKKLQKLKGHADWDKAAVFSSDGKKVITIDEEATIRIWMVE